MRGKHNQLVGHVMRVNGWIVAKVIRLSKVVGRRSDGVPERVTGAKLRRECFRRF